MEEGHSGQALIDPYKILEKIGLKEGMRVADLGCGRTGHFIFPMAKIVGEIGIIYAIDIIKDVLESIKSRIKTEGYNNIQAVWSNVEKSGAIPIPGKSLDVCMFINVLFGVKDKTQALKEAIRLLNDHGKLVVIDWTRKLGPLGPSNGLMVNRTELIQMAQNNGLKLADNFSAGDYHFCLIFKK